MRSCNGFPRAFESQTTFFVQANVSSFGVHNRSVFVQPRDVGTNWRTSVWLRLKDVEQLAQEFRVLQTKAAADQLLGNFLDLPPMYSLRSCSDALSILLAMACFWSLETLSSRASSEDTSRAVKLHLLDMLAPRQQVEHLLAGVPDVTEQLVLVRKQITIRTSERVYTGGTQQDQYELHFHPTHKKNKLRIRCNQSKIVATGASDSNVRCILVSMPSKIIQQIPFPRLS